MFVNGVITPVILDDWFPTVYGKAAFCSSNNGEIWPMLFEKAWAKLYGSYGRTVGGLCCHAAEHMTGLPTKSFEHKEVKDKDAFFKKMLKFDKDHLTILAGSTDGDDSKFVDGIAQGHAYAVLSFHEIQAHGRQHQLVKMRNPWGHGGEWTGEWSDKDEASWTPAIKKELG